MNVTKVSVTEDHISRGKACHGSDCPIALAVLGALAAEGATVDMILVDGYEVTVTVTDADGPRRFRAPLDSRGVHFVAVFDEADGGALPSTVEPFEMELRWRELAR